jgi:transcriptional regulator with GAF, ATPase, and Fis domain
MVQIDEIRSLLDPLLKPLSEGVIICDSTGCVLTANGAVYNLFDISDDTRQISLSNISGHNLRSSLIKAGLAEANGHSHHCEVDMHFEEQVNINGESRWFQIDSSLLSLPSNGDMLRMIVMHDITAEKRLTAVLGIKDECGFVSEDPDMLRLIERIDVVAGSDASVLFQGESGTGKNELARRLHQRSKRANQSFIEVNCGAIPASLIETELFGHVKGAFTGAVNDRPGRFRAADGGTLFLDEISELPRELQPKLLRVLQNGEYEPVGSDKTQKVDVRVVSASNQDLSECIDNKTFRDDLYYRIAVVPFYVPPLRDRPGDIPLLMDVLQQRLVTRGYPGNILFSREAMRPIMNYPWPGNVRELANVVEHSLICAVDNTVLPESLPDTLQQYCAARTNTRSQKTPKIDERERIQNALRKANGNKTLASQLLDIDRTTLWRRMQRLDIDW